MLAVVVEQVHIVYMGNNRIKQSEQQLVEDSHLDILSRILGSKDAARKSILYSYKHGFSGFAAVLSQPQARLIADFPGVVRVIPNKILSLHTTRSWDFLNVKQEMITSALSRGQSGRGTIIGIMDTGIWPESESFRDEHMGNPPLHWRGVCQGGENFNRSTCNRKIIGARWYIKGYEAEIGKDLSKFYPIVFGEDIAASDADEESARGCNSGSLNATLAKGKAILCFQSRSQRSATVAIRTVTEAGGSGLIFAQFPTKDVDTSWSKPCVQVDFITGTTILSYIEATRDPVIKFGKTKTVVGQQISPEVAFFSSRGPSSLSPSVLKALISCAFSEASLKNEYHEYIWAEGAPHKQADPFDYGGGHVDPNKVTDPGLVYDMKNSDYIHFLCSMDYNDTAISFLTGVPTKCHKSHKYLLNMNLPSIIIPELKQPLTVSRTVTNVGPVKSVYTARVEAPIGVSVTVEPPTLTFSPKRKKMKFKVTFSSKLRIQGRFSFGYLFWEGGSHEVRMPLAVRSVVQEFCAQT
ncbi:hypothetical protein ACSQ67_022261 [Phaseolus vulgaris]